MQARGRKMIMDSRFAVHLKGFWQMLMVLSRGNLIVTMALALCLLAGISAAEPPEGARIVEDGWFAPIERTVPRSILPDEITKAFVIPIDDAIMPALYDRIKRKVAKCKGKGAEIIIFDMNTPGGSTQTMDKIVKLITDDLKTVYTVAYINPDAFSAGAVIAMACDEIIVSPRTRFGAAMVFISGPEGPKELPTLVRQKFDSAFRTIMRSMAHTGGYEPVICEAMTEVPLVVWKIRNIETKQLMFVNAKDWTALENAPFGELGLDKPLGKKLPKPGWEYVETFDDAKQLVSLDAKQSVYCGFSEHNFDSIDKMKDHYNIKTELVVLEDSWSETLVAWLTSPALASLLLLIGIVGVITEIRTPGFGVPGIIGLLCFGILFGSQFLSGLANWWEIGLFALGLILIVLEVFVIPGFGVAGILGITFCLIGLVAMFIPNAPTEIPLPRGDLALGYFYRGVLSILLGFIGSGVAVALLVKYFKKLPFANRLVLADVDILHGPPATAASVMRKVSVGDIGTVETVCRPVGQVRIDGELVDAMADGTMIEPGEKVRVIEVEGNRLVIEKLSS